MWPQSIFGHDFFISYRRGDRTSAYASCLHEELLKRNYRCFFDRKEFEAGPNFERRLSAEVRNSRIVLLIVDVETGRSKYVHWEIDAAVKRRRSVIPISIDRAFDEQDWPALTGC